jgi:exosortase family protein XrtF
MGAVTKGPFLRFALKAGALYLALYLAYVFFFKQFTRLDQDFIAFIISGAESILHALGYNTIQFHESGNEQVIGIDGTTGIWVGPGCNALTLFALFSVFIICYPGSQRHKLWYVPIGIVLIHLLNIIRVVALTIIAFRMPSALDFNHTYTFTFIVYAFIFLLWMVWVNRFAPLNRTET